MDPNTTRFPLISHHSPSCIPQTTITWFTRTIQNALVRCDSLSCLNVSNNQLGGGSSSIPLSSTMEFLYLGSNDFQGSIPGSFADEVCSTLLELDLSFNNFSGSLKELTLAFNHFKGALPDSFSMLTSLQYLDLSTNDIDYKIPLSICENPDESTSNLKELYLQNNRFTGFNYLTDTLPTTLGSLLHLKDLIMWMNNLHGDIPSQLTSIKALENLILDYNHLTAKQSGKMAIGLVVGKKFVYLRNYGGQGCRGTSNLLEFAGIRSNAMDRIPTMCKFQQVYQAQFETFPASRFSNNTGLYGYPLPPCKRKSDENSSQHRKHGKQASLAGRVAMGLLFSLFCIFGLIIVGTETKKRRKKKESL
ncbi:Brassinosteroid LRR receptor kinase [Bienertia sinuspersici]